MSTSSPGDRALICRVSRLVAARSPELCRAAPNQAWPPSWLSAITVRRGVKIGGSGSLSSPSSARSKGQERSLSTGESVGDGGDLLSVAEDQPVWTLTGGDVVPEVVVFACVGGRDDQFACGGAVKGAGLGGGAAPGEEVGAERGAVAGGAPQHAAAWSLSASTFFSKSTVVASLSMMASRREADGDVQADQGASGTPA